MKICLIHTFPHSILFNFFLSYILPIILKKIKVLNKFILFLVKIFDIM
ncbi:hypothetical protein HMPREF9108_00081 [Leptotrichia sp. oral taxon 225 str. F0581]|nr:hypothetical protein HMPREF9108_00081 [Leptotrichia sp. oral taxon 225 str. F0581]